MPVPARLALLHTDPRAAAALSFGFEREGTEVACAKTTSGLAGAVAGGSQLVIAGGRDTGEAEENLATVRAALEKASARVPVLYFGNGIARSRALDGGASEFLPEPAYVRDVVTLARLMTTPPSPHRNSVSAELSEHFGLFYLVRTLSRVRRTGVLSLVRGLRRGELRFYEGEVTSAQIGAMHGLAALHQLLLWTDARFELRPEAVVRRRQIPLDPGDVLEDCERFLREIRSVAGELSPSAVCAPGAEARGADLPPEVIEVRALFDGGRTVADVIEDSPFRVFETLRIARRLAELEYVRPAASEVNRPRTQTALAIEEWLVGGAVPQSAVVVDEGPGPLGPEPGQPASPPALGQPPRPRGAAREKARPATGPVGPTDRSWSDLLPSRSSDEHTQVVPATAAAGEIETRPSQRAASRVGIEETPDAPRRERHEETVDGAQLSKIFVDEGLGASSPGTPPAEAASTWEEITSPATKLAIAASESSPGEDGDAVWEEALARANAKIRSDEEREDRAWQEALAKAKATAPSSRETSGGRGESSGETSAESTGGREEGPGETSADSTGGRGESSGETSTESTGVTGEGSGETSAESTGVTGEGSGETSAESTEETFGASGPVQSGEIEMQKSEASPAVAVGEILVDEGLKAEAQGGGAQRPQRPRKAPARAPLRRLLRARQKQRPREKAPWVRREREPKRSVSPCTRGTPWPRP